jgi:Zn-dependent peptidase ImmA (M78 family)/transcriptional regulator with XRE-family HTH domain
MVPTDRISRPKSRDELKVEGVFNPSRLTLARKRRGLTKLELAFRVGVDLRAISAFEGGEYAPSEETQTKVCSALEFPEEFFSSPELDLPTPDIASFRSLARMTAARRDMALAEGALALSLNKWLEERFELPSSDLPDLGRESSARTNEDDNHASNDDADVLSETMSDTAGPEAAAYALRRHWGLGEQPIKNMIHLMEAKGVRIFSLAIDAHEVDAFSMWRESTPFVFLNSYKSAEHSRFDVAHELGHLVLHRHGIPQGRVAEREADAFASSFLMPRSGVLAKPLKFPTIAGLLKAKKTWGVSVAALNYRLHSLNLTGDWQYRSLCIEIAKRGFRTREPEEMPRETSHMLPEMLAVLYREGVSRSQIAKALCITPNELEQLLFGLVMTQIEGGRKAQSDGPKNSSSLYVVGRE